MVLTEEDKKQLNELAEKSAFDSFIKMKPELWENSILWKKSQESLLNNWISELKEEIRHCDEEDEEYIKALLIRVHNMLKRVKN